MFHKLYKHMKYISYMINKKFQKNIYFIFRLIIGIGFFMHGSSKLFGWFSTMGPVNMLSIFGVAGIIEFIVGILIILGLFVSAAAIFGASTMIGALLIVHFPKGINPMANGGELPILYLVSMLILIAFGSGKYSLENKIFKKEFCH